MASMNNKYCIINLYLVHFGSNLTGPPEALVGGNDIRFTKVRDSKFSAHHKYLVGLLPKVARRI